ncbi:hypothetical protein GGI19_002613 [Coemansia pectinata]|uniref:Uncharacterized protein n=1 Tax=Coemansia pectinata TaxID=1052879 RepID=A0A9W8GZS2_9FUNG|nr:hypothetical protein GGI19_002613 [Coemansia pectinata]
MYSYITLAIFALASFVAAAPMPIPDGVLGGVVDAAAPITAGLGVTLNNLLGFTDSPSGGSGQGGSASGGSGQGGNASGGSGQGGNASGGSGQGGNASGGSGQGGNASGGSGQGGNASGGSGQGGKGGSSSGVLGGVVDAAAPITAGVGKTVNELAGFN